MVENNLSASGEYTKEVIKLPQDMDAILKLIDELREKLHSESKSKPLTDPTVVKASQDLNKVLDEYYRLLMKKKENDE